MEPFSTYLWTLENVAGLKRRTEARVSHHKILGTLHLHGRPENTQRDSVYKISGLYAS